MRGLSITGQLRYAWVVGGGVCGGGCGSRRRRLARRRRSRSRRQRSRRQRSRRRSQRRGASWRRLARRRRSRQRSRRCFMWGRPVVVYGGGRYRASLCYVRRSKNLGGGGGGGGGGRRSAAVGRRRSAVGGGRRSAVGVLPLPGPPKGMIHCSGKKHAQTRPDKVTKGKVLSNLDQVFFDLPAAAGTPPGLSSGSHPVRGA